MKWLTADWSDCVEFGLTGAELLTGADLGVTRTEVGLTRDDLGETEAERWLSADWSLP